MMDANITRLHSYTVSEGLPLLSSGVGVDNIQSLEFFRLVLGRTHPHPASCGIALGHVIGGFHIAGVVE